MFNDDYGVDLNAVVAAMDRREANNFDDAEVSVDEEDDDE